MELSYLQRVIGIACLFVWVAFAFALAVWGGATVLNDCESIGKRICGGAAFIGGIVMFSLLLAA